MRNDNRWQNLRLATRPQNQFNRQTVQGESRFRGVSVVRKGHLIRWVATLSSDYLGYFFSEEEAARAYDRAILARDPAFGHTNFPRSDYDLAAAS